MPVLVPTSTWRVPDGYTIPPAIPWVGDLSQGDLITFAWTSSQAAQGSTSPDFDVGIDTAPPTNSGFDVPNAVWGQGGSGSFTIPRSGAWQIELAVGGNHVGDPGGTIFNLSVGVVYANPGFNPADATLTLQTANTIAPFGYASSSVLRGWTGSGALQLETGVTAISWTFAASSASFPNSGGTPIYYYTNGFCTPFQQWGSERSTRVSFSPQLMRLPSSVHEVLFFLPPGLVLDITQLVPSSGST